MGGGNNEPNLQCSRSQNPCPLILCHVRCRRSFMLWNLFRLQTQHRVLLPLLLLLSISTFPIYFYDRISNTVGRRHEIVRVLCASWSGGVGVGVLDIIRVLGREGFVFVVGWLIGIVAITRRFSEVGQLERASIRD